jgi:uncharacterized repeat protein (TIGR03803 family)
MKRISLFLAGCLALTWQDAGAAPYQLIHAFRGGAKDGRTPTSGSSLIASGNVFYGMTEDGGKYTNGVLFKINSDGTDIQIIHAFDGDSILNMNGSKNDGAYPFGTPVLAGSTLYGMTGEGGSNGYVGGTIFSVNTDGTGFKLLHDFGGIGDGWAPEGSLILSGSTLYGMTSEGGTNLQTDEGIIFSIQTNGSGYTPLVAFTVPGQGNPWGSLLLWGTTLYGMTQGSIFRVNTDGSEFLVVHPFTGSTTDGGLAYGSLVRQGAYLYGMTFNGGQNGVGTVFSLDLLGSVFQVLHNFSTSEAYNPRGDLVLSSSTLYGMTYGGVTNIYRTLSGGSGAVFQIQTNGLGYQVMHTFEFPVSPKDGSLPYGSPMILGSKLYGMTSLGGSEGLPLASQDGGCIFALTLPPGSGSGGAGAPTISTTTPLPNGKVGVAYHQQLAATGGTTPYTWSVSAGHLPPGLLLSAAGVLGGKPTKGEIADFSIKVTGHDKESFSQAFSLTIEVPPTLTIKSPKAAEKVTTPTWNVSGTASSTVSGVEGVYVRVNGGPWTLAQTANSFANWSVPNFPLPADADVLSAYAVDFLGNFSKTNSVKFEYYVTGPLIVTTNGDGTFTPKDNGKDLQIGATFVITAKPARGSTFVDWTDGSGKNVLTNKPGLKFVMASNLMLIANFATAPRFALVDEPARTVARPDKRFQQSAGTYTGLFAPLGDARQITNSGAIRLTLTESGLFSGKLTFGGESLPFSGSFDASGAARIILAREKIDLTAALQLDSAHQSVSGELTDGGFLARIAAYRGGFGAIDPAGNYKGTYRVVLTGANDSSAPLSASGTVTVDELGNVFFAATLPDGSHASQMSAISREGYWPLYLPLHWTHGAESGTLWAWDQITNGTVHSLPASATWITGTRKTAVQIISTGFDAVNQQ